MKLKITQFKLEYKNQNEKVISEKIEMELHRIINDETYRNNILAGYSDIRCILSSPHQAAVTASQIIYKAADD